MMNSIPQEYIEGLNDMSTAIERVVLDESFPIAVKQNTPELLNYLKHHINDALAVITEEIPSEASITLYKNIVTAEPAFLEIFCKDIEFNKQICRIIVDQNTHEEVLVRILRIISQFFFKAPHFLPQNYVVTDTLIYMIDKPCVLNLIDAILSSGQSLLQTVLYIRKQNIPRKIYNLLAEVSSLPSDSKSKYSFGPVDTKRLAAFQIVSRIARNPILGSINRHQKFLKILFKQPQDLPTYIKNFQWDAMLSVMNIKQIRSADFVLEKSIEILRNLAESDHFHQYMFHAFTIFNQVLIVEPLLTLKQIDSFEIFVSQLLNGIKYFKYATNLHIQFRRFYNICLTYHSLSILIVRICVPFFVEICSTLDNRVLAATLNELLIKTIDIAKKKQLIKDELRNIPEFAYYATSTLREYKNITSENYGVDPPGRIYSFFAKFFN